MALRLASNRACPRLGTAYSALSLALLLAACAGDDSDRDDSAGSGTGPVGAAAPTTGNTTPGQVSAETEGPQPGGTPSSTGAASNTTAADTSSGAEPSTGGVPRPAGESSSGGAGGAGTTPASPVGMGGAGESDSSGAGGRGPIGDGAAGDGSGGDSSASGGSGSDGSASGGSAGAGDVPSSDECTRQLLDSLLDDYFAALGAGDPSSLPLSASLEFTENAEVTEIGTTDFWMNAGDVVYSQRALDTEQCSVAAQAVVPEAGMDLPIALRIKVEAEEMTEIETLVVRPGDYTASFAVESNPGAIISMADEIGWHEEVPEAERATRQELSAWIEKYFRAFPSGVCNVTADCRRLENGGGNFSCGESCSAGDPGPGGTFEPRVIIVDEVRGIAAGLTIFDFMTTGHLDMHMIKMSGGQVHAVQAILGDTGGQSGWD